MSRIKLRPRTVAIPATRQEAEQTVRHLVEIKTTERALKAELDGKIAELKQRYESQIADLADQTLPCVESLQAWAEAHPEEFGGRRSLEMLSGTIGWRTTPPAVKPARGFTWQSVLEVLKERGRTEFVRLKEEVNREALLAAREAEDLRALHVRVEQVDEFFVEPKLTPATGREVAA